eukprot:1138327-Karenia_brevis.AAC.1
MSFEGLSGVVKNESGTMAGMSLADVMFISAFKRVIGRITDCLGSAGLVHEIDVSGVNEFFSVQ